MKFLIFGIPKQANYRNSIFVSTDF
jgi:hypothetical protein